MRRWTAAAIGLALAGCGSRDRVAVKDAWVRLPAVPGRPAVAYFRLEAPAHPVTLVGTESPQAARAEMHNSMAAGGMATMTPLSRVTVPAGGGESFAPGGRHVMLFGLKPSVTAGTTVRLDLLFSDGQRLSSPAKVVAAADPAPA